MDLPQITSMREDEYFFDTVFAIVEHRSEAQSLILTCEGLDEDRIVGFEVRTYIEFAAALVERGGDVELDPDAVIRNGVILNSIGEKTFAFLEALKAGYRLDSQQEPHGNSLVETTVIPLHQKPIRLDRDLAKLKLFFDQHPDEDRYWEAYLNIDLSEGLVFFNEKDIEYRQPILDTFNEAWGRR